MLFPVYFCLIAASWLATVKCDLNYVGKITNDPSVAHIFGYQVALWNTTRFAATAKHADRKVFIYDLVGSDWSQSYVLQKAEWTQGQQMSLAFQSADCLFATSYFTGIFVYRLSEGSWSLEATYTPTILVPLTVAVEGSNVLIGYGNGGLKTEYFTYTQSDGFTLIQALTGMNSAYNNFGMGVAINDNIAMVTQGDANTIFFYSLQNGLFTQQSTLSFTIGPAAIAFDNTIGVGVVGGTDGVYYIIQKTDTYTWALVMKKFGAPSDNSARTSLAWGVAMSGSTVLMSACKYPTIKQGEVYQYVWGPSPTATPTRVPSLSSMPTFPHTHHPSIKPTAHPTFSLWPTRLPTMIPSMEPSEVPSEMPSAAPTDTRMPSVSPTRRPSRTPTWAVSAPPTMAAVEISFNSDIYLHNVSVSVLDTASQSAVVGAVADTLSLGNDQVSVVSQSSVGTDGGRRVLTEATPHYEVKVVVKVDASTRDFEDATNQDGEYLFMKLTTILVDAVETQAFALTVREQSALLNASGTMYVGQVNVTASASYVATNAVSEPDKSDSNDDFSRGDFAGVVIGIVVSFLIMVGCVLAVWKYRGGASADAGKSEVQLTGVSTNQV